MEYIIIFFLIFLSIELLTNLPSIIIDDISMCLANIRRFKIQRYEADGWVERLDCRSQGNKEYNYEMVGWIFFNWFIGCKWIYPVKWREWVETEAGTGRKIQHRESSCESISYYLD